MRTLIVSTGFVLALPLLSVARAETIVELRTMEETTLPGIPVPMELKVTNSGVEPITLAADCELEVTRPGGEIMRPAWDGPQHGNALLEQGNLNPITVPPHASKTFLFERDEVLSRPGWFYDGRLTLPGDYQYRAIVKVEAEGQFVEVFSNPVNHVVESPTGPDREVWNRMLELSGGKGWGLWEWIQYPFAIAHFVWENHPDSRYFQFTAMFTPVGPGVEEKIQVMERALELYPDGPMNLHIRLGLAHWYRDLGGRISTLTGDLTATAVKMLRARDLLEGLLERPVPESVEKRAHDILRDIPPREYLEEVKRTGQWPAPPQE